MKKFLGLFVFALLFISCHKKDGGKTEGGCDMQQVYTGNAKKLTLTNGIWGTVSSVEGNCMPTVPASSSSCRSCPVQRTVKIYEYTLLKDAVSSDPYKIFFDAFTTRLVAQGDTDDDGFFQADIPPGHYSIVVVEGGKLYANSRDGGGGLNPFTFMAGTQNVNITMTYRAVF
jgi:hypothetical protein